MQLSKTPQITFGIKHSPLLGQLKPIEPLRPIQKPVTQKITSQNYTTIVAPSKDIRHESNDEFCNNIDKHSNINETNETTHIHNARTQVTQVRAESELRSSTVTPEPVQEQLTQELVWVPDKPIRRGSYTIDKSDGFTEKFQNSEVIPVQNGIVRIAASGERGSACTEETNNEVTRREGFEQEVQKNVKNSSAFEKTQAATEDVRTGTEVKQLPNGGISKTTTTTTVRKVGTAAKTMNASSTVTRTATAVTSRDVGAK